MKAGELGYVLSHAYGAVFDNPDLITCCVIGDGEAETGPLAGSWHSNKFLNPIRDGAVLPILHLNGYKIASATVLARISQEELQNLLIGYGYQPYFVTGDDPKEVHQQMAATLNLVIDEIREIQKEARIKNISTRPKWPVIIMRTPKGWTCPSQIDGKKMEGSWRSHQVPFSDLATNPAHLKILESWMKSYHPEELFTKKGKLKPELLEACSEGTSQNGGKSPC